MMFDDVVREKISELELISSWASVVQFGRVRDLCREAEYELKKWLESRANLEPVAHSTFMEVSP